MLAVSLNDLSIIVPIVLGLALFVSALSHAALEAKHQDLADELDTTKEALDAGAHLAAQLASGKPLVQALESLPQDREAVDLFKKTFESFKRHTGAVVLLFLLLAVGCSSITRGRIDHLRKAIHDEREAVTVRPGFESDVALVRSAEDADIAALESASK